MLLPIPSNRPLLRSYWLILSLGFSVFVGSVLIVTGTTEAWPGVAGGVAAGLLMAVPGMLFPYSVALPYRAWNWLVRRFSVLAIRYVTRVCFWTVGLAYTRLGIPSGFERSVDGVSAWRPCETQSTDSYKSEFRTDLGPDSREIDALRAWSRDVAPPFAWLFLPFLVAMDWLDAGGTRDEVEATHIYTLY